MYKLYTKKIYKCGYNCPNYYFYNDSYLNNNIVSSYWGCYAMGKQMKWPTDLIQPFPDWCPLKICENQ